MMEWDDIIGTLRNDVAAPKKSRWDARLDIIEQAVAFINLSRYERDASTDEIQKAAARYLLALAVFTKQNGYANFQNWELTDDDVILDAPREIMLLRLVDILYPEYIRKSPLVVLTVLYGFGIDYKETLELALYGQARENPASFLDKLKKVKKYLTKHLTSGI